MPFEARDASGNVEPAHVEVVVANAGMMFGFVAATAVGLVGAYLAFAVMGGVFGWILGILAAFVGIVGIVSLAAAVYGRYVGMPWLFTP